MFYSLRFKTADGQKQFPHWTVARFIRKHQFYSCALFWLPTDVTKHLNSSVPSKQLLAALTLSPRSASWPEIYKVQVIRDVKPCRWGAGTSRQQPAQPSTRHIITEDPNSHHLHYESLRSHKQIWLCFMFILLRCSFIFICYLSCEKSVKKIQTTKNPTALNKRVF